MKRVRWATVGVLLLAAFLRLHELGQASLWMDEAVSVFAGRASLSDTFDILLSDAVHPPLYYFIQKISFPLGGGEFALRWPAAMIGVLAIAAIALLGTGWLGRSGGILAASLAALSPFAVSYSREARMYSLLVLLVTAAMWSFAQLIEEEEKGRLAPLRERGRMPFPHNSPTRRYTGFTLISSALYLTHYFGLFAPLIQLVYLLLTFRRTHRHLRAWLTAQLVAGLPIAIWTVALYSRGAAFGIGWIHPVSWLAPVLTLQNFAVGYGDEGFRWITTGLFGLAAMLGLWAIARGDRDRSLLLALWLLLPLLVTLALSSRRPSYVDRFLIGSLPPLMLAVAAGLGALQRRMRPVVPAMAGLLLILPMSLGTYLTVGQAEARETWREAAQFISSEEQPEDVLLLRSVIYQLPFGYYYRGPLQAQFVDAGWRLVPPEELKAQRKRLWLVYRGRLEDAHQFGQSLAADFGRDEADGEVLAWLRVIEPYRVEQRDFPGVAVSLYDFSPTISRP